ncbi:MAG: M3 family metallopeptidase [Acidimicrobiia bacterium]
MGHDLSTATPTSIADAVDRAIAAAELLVEGACSAPSDVFADRVAPLDAAMGIVQDASGYGPFLANCHPDKGVRDAGNDARERLEKWASDLIFRSDINAAVHAVDPRSVTGNESRSLSWWLRDLRRAGHSLDADQREELQRLRSRLIELEVSFNRNIAEHTDHLDVARDDLEGLPAVFVESLSEGETPGSVRVTLDYPDYQPFMQQAANRSNRRVLQHKYLNQAVEPNRPILAEAIAIRSHMAELLGFPTWADHQMEIKMADTDAVNALYASITPGLTEKAREELAALARLLDADEPGAELSTWDWVYYDTQQARNDFGVDHNEVAQYFPLELVIDAMFDITGRVFGLIYEQVDDVRTWHDEVRTYRIIDGATSRSVAVFHLDLHPREGKYSHAACWSLQKGCRLSDGTYRMPSAAILANFTKPTADAPSLLRHDEAVTLFHEFGHALHECLTEVDMQRFAGFDTEWDFVEAPSQIMENWMWNAEILKRYARHHRTGTEIPDALIEGLVKLRDHNIALKTLRQIYYGTLDLAFHTSGPSPDMSVIDRQAHELTLLPFHEDTFFAAGFGHLLGGYDAGYYGYLWSMVYGDDMFSVFEQQGVLSTEVGARFRREILAAGSSRDAIEHLRAFLGREPNANAFMRKIGL